MCPVAWCSADPCASACCKLVVWIVPVGTCYDWFKVQLAKSQLPQSLFCSYQSSSCAKPINTKPWATAAEKAVLECTESCWCFCYLGGRLQCGGACTVFNGRFVFFFVCFGWKWIKNPNEDPTRCARFRYAQMPEGTTTPSVLTANLGANSGSANDFRIACCFLARFAGGSEVLGNGAAAMMWDFTVYNLSQMDASRAADTATSRHTRVEAVKPCPFRKEGCCAPC